MNVNDKAALTVAIDEFDEFFIAQKIRADLCKPGELRVRRDDVA